MQWHQMLEGSELIGALGRFGNVTCYPDSQAYESVIFWRSIITWKGPPTGITSCKI